LGGASAHGPIQQGIRAGAKTNHRAGPAQARGPRKHKKKS
jgi:hypothetical protein